MPARRRSRAGRGGRPVLRAAASAFAASAFALALSAGAAPALAADPIAIWLDGIAACTRGRTLSLAVAGFDPGQTALSREQAEEVRLAIESRLQATGRVRLAPAGDVTRLKALQEGTTGLPPAEAEAQIRAAFGGDAAVFLVDPSRAGEVARLRVQAIARSADCKVTSDPVEVPVRGGPGLADIDAVMRRAVERMSAGAPDAKAVGICPFAASSGHSTCAGALTDRLAIALDAEARSPNRVLRGGALAVRRLGPGQACAAEGDAIVARGSFDHDRRGSWMNLAFERAGSTLAPTGRTRISVEALGCDPTIRPFLDHVAASARTDGGRLELSPAAVPFTKGQRLEVRIDAKVRQNLYCWLLAPDETAFVALPVRGDAASNAPAGGVRRYPRGYGLAEVVAGEAFENLFACFGLDGPLPPDLEARWMAAAPAADADARLLERAETLDLMDRIRALPGVTEATARVVVR